MSEPRWVDIPQFVPLSKEHYQRQQGFRQQSSKQTKQPRPISSQVTPRITERQKLSRLIQCLAISELDRQQLQQRVDQITRQKQELDTELSRLLSEKQLLLDQQKSIAI
jgi:hypothetical protein